MKAIEILDCIMYMGLSGEYLTKIEVPDEYDEFEPQTEEWWMHMVGAIPPAPIAAGTYILVYSGEWLDTSQRTYAPDAEIENTDGNDIYLYLLED